MKTKSFVAVVLLTFLFSFAVVAQHDHGSQQKKKSESMNDMMGKPTFEKAIDGIQIKVWLITQEEHKKMMDQSMSAKHSEGHDMGMMGDETTKESKDSSSHDHMMRGDMKNMDHSMMGKGMKHDMKGMDHKKMMETMMSGTHHVMVTITDEKNSEPVDEKEITIQITAPSTKYSTVKLTPIMNHFGAGLAFDEKGIYKVGLVLDIAKETRNIAFSYEVK
jgi:hypothetical protein